MVVLEIGIGFMNKIRFDTICNIIQEIPELQRYNYAYSSSEVWCDKISSILLSKVKCIDGMEVAFRPVSNSFICLPLILILYFIIIIILYLYLYIMCALMQQCVVSAYKI